MSFGDDVSVDAIREMEVTTDSNMKLKGETFKDRAGDLLLKLSGWQLADRPELQSVVSSDEVPVTVWVQVTKNASKRLVQEGEVLLAKVRVKRSDGTFVKKAAAFSLGAVVAVSITRRVVQHYRPR